jgi:hypothetical protein
VRARGSSNALPVAEIALGNKEEALRLLELAVDQGESIVLMSKNDIDLQPIAGRRPVQGASWSFAPAGGTAGDPLI